MTIGGDEAARGVLRLKNLATREETEMTADDMLRVLPADSVSDATAAD